MERHDMQKSPTRMGTIKIEHLGTRMLLVISTIFIGLMIGYLPSSKISTVVPDPNLAMAKMVVLGPEAPECMDCHLPSFSFRLVSVMHAC